MVSEVTKQKLRLANIGKKQSSETIEKRIVKVRGRKNTEEQRLRMSLARKNGKPSRPKGTYHHSEETKQKMRKAHLGTKHKFVPTIEHRELLRQQQTGKKYSIQTRKKISDIVKKSYAEGKHNFQKSFPEKIIENVLIKNGVNYKYQAFIKRRSVDFLVFPNKVIECDGDFWHGTEYMYEDENTIHPVLKIPVRELRQKDAEMTEFIENEGYEIVRLNELFVTKYPDECETAILHFIKGA